MTLTDFSVAERVNSVYKRWNGAQYLSRFVGEHPELTLSTEMKSAAHSVIDSAGFAAKESVRWGVNAFLQTTPGRYSLRSMDWLLAVAEKNLLPPVEKLTAAAHLAKIESTCAERTTDTGSYDEGVAVSLMDRGMQTEDIYLQDTIDTDTELHKEIHSPSENRHLYRTRSCPEVSQGSVYFPNSRRGSLQSKQVQSRRGYCPAKSKTTQSKRTTTPNRSVARVRPTSRQVQTKTNTLPTGSKKRQTQLDKTHKIVTTSTPKGGLDFSFADDQSFDEFDDFSSVLLTSTVLENSEYGLGEHSDLETSDGFYQLAWTAVNEAADDYENFLSKANDTSNTI